MAKPWVKILNGMATHPRVNRTGLAGFGLHVAAICYCNEHLTDGFVPKGVATQAFGMLTEKVELTIRELVEVELWLPVEGGFQIRDYADYQKTRAQVKQKSEVGRESIKKRWAKDAGHSPDDRLPIGGLKVAYTEEEEETEEEDVSTNVETRAFDFDFETTNLCELLSDEITSNGSKRPTVTIKWLEEADRLLRIDKRDPDAAAELIRWCQQDDFWRANIQSMPKFRKQYDQLRLQKKRGEAKVPLTLKEQMADWIAEG